MNEQNLKIGGKINATISYPMKFKEARPYYPAVILLHGLGTNKDEVGGFYTILARKLAELSMFTLRIDFQGWGESAGLMADTTINSLINDALIATEYLCSLEEIDANRIGVCGFSLGAAIAILSSQFSKIHYKSLVALSPAGDLETDIYHFLGKYNRDKIKSEKGPYQIDLGWRQIVLNESFFQSLSSFSPFEVIQYYKGAFLTAAGTSDFTIENSQNYYTLCSSTVKAIKTIADADHVFNIFDEEKSKANMVIDETCNWLQQKL